MNWKQIIYTAIITLLVTILSGILVNWYTLKNINVSKNEELVYEVKNISRFKSDSLNISIYNIIVSNIGNVKSEDVSLKLDFNEPIEIIDLTSNLERTEEIIKPVNNENQQLIYTINKLFPKDNFTASIALKNSIENPKVILQSNNIVGRPISVSKTENEEKTLFKIKYFAAIFIAILTLFPVLYFSTRIFRRVFGEYPQNLNNTAFLSIHNGQLELARKLLEKEIATNGGTTSELSNYGLVKFLQGKNSKEYEPLLRMADFLSKSLSHNKLVLSFNRMIIYAKNNEFNKLENEFKTATQSNKTEFKKWYHYSVIISEMKSNDKQLKEKLLQLEKKYLT
ncbi:hypothetical protein V1387_00770 [Allomuricauda taeanensis]|uniref:hypothetical protein n=1 Tax=Flagellimonas taeanensis TaxID=1005926 RepID=UPI002E7C03C7|nr:hypothetical protein [Allomuricauda taeanensis]MEE1961195.1 hypothetical protein [Allomuricauda taeanensis]